RKLSSLRCFDKELTDEATQTRQFALRLSKPRVISETTFARGLMRHASLTRSAASVRLNVIAAFDLQHYKSDVIILRSASGPLLTGADEMADDLLRRLPGDFGQQRPGPLFIIHFPPLVEAFREAVAHRHDYVAGQEFDRLLPPLVSPHAAERHPPTQDFLDRPAPRAMNQDRGHSGGADRQAVILDPEQRHGHIEPAQVHPPERAR